MGICFSGGGIKGAAHIGVLKALEEENIKFEYISGTSSGSIIATLYAIGLSSEEIYEIFKKYSNRINYIDFTNFFNFIINIFKKRKLIFIGLNSGKKIEKLVNKECAKKGIENINQIEKKLLIPSVSLSDGKVFLFSSIKNRNTYSDQMIYINDINIGKAVRASCSFPGVFSPMKWESEYLIDGGIRENVPWKELKEIGADKTISIIFQNDVQEKENMNIIDIISNSIDILCHELSTYELKDADFLVEIETKNIHLLDKKKIDYLYYLGYIEMKAKMKELKQVIKKQ